eukprot:764414-Hanusia_phi.AAC.4
MSWSWAKHGSTEREDSQRGDSSLAGRSEQEDRTKGEAGGRCHVFLEHELVPYSAAAATAAAAAAAMAAGSNAANTTALWRCSEHGAATKCCETHAQQRYGRNAGTGNEQRVEYRGEHDHAAAAEPSPEFPGKSQPNCELVSAYPAQLTKLTWTSFKPSHEHPT